MAVKRLDLFLACLLFLAFIGISCKKKMTDELTTSNNSKTNLQNMRHISDSLQVLESNAIYFGHQSVGFNIVSGIQEILKDNSRVHLNLKEIITSDTTLQIPAFLHSPIGRNGEPISKIDDFVQFIKQNGDKLDIAFMKLCYVDITRKTDVDKLFSYYKASMDSIENIYPNLQIVHFTVPLTLKPTGIKGLIKKLIRMDNNVFRSRYNELIRKSYPENKVFDIAGFESTYPDGTRYTYGLGIPGLIPDYASDEGHLNSRGRLHIASKLLEKMFALK